MYRSVPLFALLLAGCAAPSPESPSAAPATAAPSTSNPLPSAASKVVEAVPPVNIGDGSAIAFTHWKGMRKGSGSLRQAGKAQTIHSFDLELNPDQTMALGIDGKPEITFKGTWRKKDDKTVELALPDTATGTLLFMDRANPYQLSLQGKEFSLEFRVSE